MGQPELARGKPKMSRDQDFVTIASTRNHNPAYCKVPGNLTAVGKMTHEISALKTQMKNKTASELQEMFDRQKKLVENSALLRKLPDKGKKAVEKLGVLKDLVEEKNEELMLSRAMARLNLPDTDALEWGGNFSSHQETEETLRVLAERELPSRTEKEMRKDVDNYQANKVTNLDHFKSPARFAPFSCAKSKDASLKQKTPAVTNRVSPVVKTPSIPLPQVYECSTKQLSLQESMEVQREYVARHREASLKQAAARLSSFNKPKPEFNQTVDIKISDLNWREPVHVDMGEFEEEHADEDDEEGGGVNVIAFEDEEE